MAVNTHPTLPEFEYVRLETPAQASEFLVQHAAEARPFLGGTDVFVRMRDGFLSPKFLVDVKHLDGADEMHFAPRHGLTIGAGVCMNRVIASPDVQRHYPLLAEACQSVAGYQLRSRATIVGNICNASPAGDTLGACLVLDGVLHIHGPGGPRQEKLAGFFLGPGKTRLQPGDIVTAIHLPPPAAGSTGTYLKLGRNKLSDLSIVGVTVWAAPAPELAAGYAFRVALASVAPVPLLAVEAAQYLAGQAVSPASLRQAAALAAAACTPIDDVRGSARYRKAMAQVLTRQGLEIVWNRLR